MALKIVTKKRFIAAMKKVTGFLKQEWNISVAEDFVNLINKKITLLASQPNIGTTTPVDNTRSVLVGKGHQNKIYYRVEKNKLIIINLKDVRKNPKQNRYT
jgi:plasmid stabilization system protein ParE